MKKLFFLCTAALLAASTMQSHAQPRANTWYGKADLGGSWIEDTELKELFGPVVGDNTVEFDPGVRFGLGMGYNVTEWFAGEFEFGMSWNDVDKAGAAQSLDAMLINVPFLINAKLQLPNPSRLRPYVGAGMGGTSTVLDIDRLDYGNIRVTGSASDVTFAWQGFAGVQFDLNEYMTLGVEYRYVWTQSPDYNIDWGFFFNIDSDKLELDDIETHSVSLVFTYRF